MNIDTLILSGGSTKGISFLGSINYLIKNKYIDNELKNIKKVICVSASYLFILSLILLNYNRELIEKNLMTYNYNKLLDINDMSLKHFVNEYGFINYCRTHIHIKKLLKERYNVESMSLLKLYKLSGIHIIVKVVNVSEQKVEYIDHINNPKMNILKLIQMTTAIPILIKPIKYKNNLYCDGGLCGNCPIEINDSYNYLSIDILPSRVNKKINNLYDYLQSGWSMYTPDILIRKYDKNNIKIDLTELDLNPSSFDINYDMRKKLLIEGYRQTEEHFNHHQYLQQNNN